MLKIRAMSAVQSIQTAQMMVILMSFLALPLFSSCSTALGDTTSLSCSLYNSEDSLDVSLGGENFDFKGSAILEPTSLYYRNGGGSTQPDCSYDYSASFNGVTLESGAESDSGAFSWHTNADSNYCGDGARSFDLSAKNMVKDGTLSSHYSNPDHGVEEDVDVDGAHYSESIKLSEGDMDAEGQGSSHDDEFYYSFSQTMDEEEMGSEVEADSGASVWKVSVDDDKGEGSAEASTLTATNLVEDGSLKSSYFNPNLDVEETVDAEKAVYLEKETITHGSIDSSGNGVTIEKEESTSPSEGQSDTKGLHQSIGIKDEDKWSEVTADVEGDTDVQWVGGVKSDASKSSVGLRVDGYGTITEMDQLKMIGKAKDFPIQTLPAGDVDISYNYPYRDKGFLDSLELYREEVEEFFDDYHVEVSPALYYYLNQKMYVNSYEIPPDPNDALLPEDHYKMNMAFTMKEA